MKIKNLKPGNRFGDKKILFLLAPFKEALRRNAFENNLDETAEQLEASLDFLRKNLKQFKRKAKTFDQNLSDLESQLQQKFMKRQPQKEIPLPNLFG